ncbi:EmrB/QacA subfamily drug resistance transporter [Paenibacillus phyllosphaerae]|uniref:EmrB/QacA subfamily drug resistance transporter n=1 Tax=Paenibacillus phyllosphaerae TaxID=274593 RepID=A0A7W5AZZ7_9BACL|nr:MDR family MFS transporter [Paenibacillus phyllosphaerae]MBB3111892.1 EmrB/QacA subfamily drug resistance transporter [Paenibacillus phyllosphaerae]
MSEKSGAIEQEVTLRQLIGPLAAVIIGMIMVILDSTVVNVALPKLVEDFNSSVTTLQWSITGYTLALSAVIPLAGWMTDRYGAKRIFLITIVLFTLGSVLCALARTPEQLVIYRIIQGLGGGMVSPIGFAMVFRLAPPGKMGSIMGVLGVPMLLAPALGPILAGYLVEYVSWHWIFLINLPIGIIAVLVGIKFLPNLERKTVPSLDIMGMILAPIAFAMLAFGVSEGGTDWGSARTLTGLIVGGVALVLFIFVELRKKQPLLELRVFGSSDFTRGIIIAWVAQISLFGSILLIPLYLQQIEQYSALKTGVILLPQALASAVFMPIGGKLYDKIGARPLVMTGLTVITAALFMLSRLSADTSLTYIMTALGMIGAGMGMTMMSINTHVLAAAPRHLVSRVTPLTTAAQQVMVSFAVAGLTGYLTSGITDNMAKGQDQITASIGSYDDTFFLSACIAIVGALLAIILRKPKAQPDDSAGSKAEDPNAAAMMGH